MADLIERDALESKIRENSMRIRFFDPSVNVILHLIRYAPAVNRWIPVDDALPDEFIYVICGGKDGIAILRYNGDVWVDDVGCAYSMSAITHWMSLPEPPKE